MYYSISEPLGIVKTRLFVCTDCNKGPHTVRAEPINLIRGIHRNPHLTQMNNAQAHLITRDQYYSRLICLLSSPLAIRIWDHNVINRTVGMQNINSAVGDLLVTIGCIN